MNDDHIPAITIVDVYNIHRPKQQFFQSMHPCFSESESVVKAVGLALHQGWIVDFKCFWSTEENVFVVRTGIDPILPNEPIFDEKHTVPKTLKL